MDSINEKLLVEAQGDDKDKPLGPIDHFTKSLKLLMKSEASLVYMFITNFLVSLQYYILVTLIPLYFSAEHGFSSLYSGVIFGGFGVVIGICSLILSSLLHKINFKRGLFSSAFLGIIGFGLMMINNTYLSLASVLTLQAVSCSMSWPFIEYGIKEYSSLEVRNLSSSCFFMSNYFAGMVSGLFIDFLWNSMEDKALMYFIIYGIGTCSLLATLGFVYFCRDVKYTEESAGNYQGLLHEKRFWRFSLLILILTLLRSACFGHLDATLPIYMVKIQDQAHFGLMLTIHSITMLIGVFTLTTLTFSYSSYSLIALGGLIGSLGSGMLSFNNEMYSFIFFVIFISIGESIWVPRLLDYTYAIVPDGHEGVYLAMSNCPFYFGMILTGSSSGLMLDNLCVEGQLEKCNHVWVIVFASSLIIMALLAGLKFVIVQPEKEENPHFSCFRRGLV